MIQITMSAMKWRWLMLAMAAMTSWLGAQQETVSGQPGTSSDVGENPSTPPPPASVERYRNPEERGRGPRPPGERDRRFEAEGGPTRGGRDRDRDRDRGEMLRRLSEEERKRVREAFDKVWVRPEVEAARARLREANDEYRKAIDLALQAVDPEVVTILNKVRPAAFPLPERDDPEFARKMMLRLRVEGPFRGDARREELNEKVLKHPAVAELLTKLYEAGPEQRRRAWEEFREAYFRVLKELDQPSNPVEAEKKPAGEAADSQSK